MVTKQEQERRVRDYRARQTVHQRRQRRQRRDSIVGALAALVVLVGGTALLSTVQPPADPAETAPAASTTPVTRTDTTTAAGCPVSPLRTAASRRRPASRAYRHSRRTATTGERRGTSMVVPG